MKLRYNLSLGFMVLFFTITFTQNSFAQWQILVEDNFSDTTVLYIDNSLKALWGNQLIPTSAFQRVEKADTSGFSQRAITLKPTVQQFNSYTTLSGIRTLSCIDYSFPTINRSQDTIMIEFDALFDELLQVGEAGRISMTLLHQYPAGGAKWNDIDSINKPHPFGRPAYNFRLFNKNYNNPNNNLTAVMMYGGGHDINGESEIYNSQWWLPGFSTEPGGTAPGSTPNFPVGVCRSTRLGSAASQTDWMSYKWVVAPELISFYAKRKLQHDSLFQTILTMAIPKDEDTLAAINYMNTTHGANITKMPTLYNWFQEVNALRIFWRAARNVSIANVKISASGGIMTTSLSEKTSQNTKQLAVNVFPNPAQNYITVQSNSLIEKIQLLDAQGKIYQSFTPFSQIVDVQLQSLPSGLYWVKLQTTQGTAIKKIVVLK